MQVTIQLIYQQLILILITTIKYIKMIITGYKYDTELDAQIARKACADYYGLPKSPEDVTQYWVDYSFAELNDPQFWYIIYDDSILDILGEPIDFKVIQNDPPLIEE